MRNLKVSVSRCFAFVSSFPQTVGISVENNASNNLPPDGIQNNYSYVHVRKVAL